jgi:GxxExxY protein
MKFDEFRAARNEVEPEMDRLTESIIGACIEVHRELGPGLTENFYEAALCRELELRGISFERQLPAQVCYKGAKIGDSRIDLVVERSVIVELKSCEGLNQIHRAQLVCYLRITKLKIGLLVNFNVPILHDGVKRVVLSS